MKRSILFLTCILLVLSPGCSWPGVSRGGGDRNMAQMVTAPPEVFPLQVTETASPVPFWRLRTLSLTPVEEFPQEPHSYHQWASDAYADEFDGGDPVMAVGEPDGEFCGDENHAWTPESGNNERVLGLYYRTAVDPVIVELIISENPGGRMRVEILNSTSGLGRVIFDGEIDSGGNCPVKITLPAKVDIMVDWVVVSLAPSPSPPGIDAVGLLGVLPDYSQLPAFWRSGGETGNQTGDFCELHQMAADDYYSVYLADACHGVYRLDIEGNILSVLQPEGAGRFVDVKIAPSGNLVLADSSGQVIVSSPQGDVITRIGSRGYGDGEFAEGYPRVLAVSPLDGNLYILDAGGADSDRADLPLLQVYSGATWEFIRSQPLDGFSVDSLVSMQFDMENNLYLLEQSEKVVLKFDPENGELLARLGGSTLAPVRPKALQVDGRGRLYVTAAGSRGAAAVYVFESDGYFLWQYGTNLEIDIDSHQSWLEGTFVDPQGIAVTPDGNFVFISDQAGGFAYVTAYNFLY